MKILMREFSVAVRNFRSIKAWQLNYLTGSKHEKLIQLHRDTARTLHGLLSAVCRNQRNDEPALQSKTYVSSLVS